MWFSRMSNRRCRAALAILLGASVVLSACGADQQSVTPTSNATTTPGAATSVAVTSAPPAASAAVTSAPPAASAAGLPAVGDVPTYKADAARSGVQPGPGPVAEPLVAWEAKLPCPIGERAPVIGNGTLFVGCDSAVLYALDARSGHEVWRADLKGALIGSAAFADGVVYAADAGGTSPRVGRGLGHGTVAR